MLFISENFRQQQKHSQPKKHKHSFVSSIPVHESHTATGLAIICVSGLISLGILLLNVNSPTSWTPYILLSLIFFVILNAIGRRILLV